MSKQIPPTKEIQESNMYVDFDTDIDSILAKFLKENAPNKQSLSDLFRHFIHFYFSGGGFDHVNDVIDVKTGTIIKLDKINLKSNDSLLGIETIVQKSLSQWVFAILDPFDYWYAPSKSFKYWEEYALPKLAKFIRS